MKIALCHEWLTTYGGSDSTAARIASLLDVDDVFTFTADPMLVDRLFDDRPVHLAHRWGSHRFVQEHWQWLLPLMPLAWSRLDLSGYDVVITSSHSCTNAICPPSTATHISYCYTPMRYAWEWRLESGRFPWPIRTVWPAAAAGFRVADRRWGRRVDHFIAISRTVARRIGECYRRDAEVVYPPVDTDYFTPGGVGDQSDYFLAAGRIVAYKRFDVAVDAFGEMGLPLVVAGWGPELDRIRKRAGRSIRFEENPSRDRLRKLYRKARALIFPGVEDFGIVPVEAQACGTPVIALNQGGVTETVVDAQTGFLYQENSVAGLVDAVKKFERMELDPGVIRANSERFGRAVFDRVFPHTVQSLMELPRRGGASIRHKRL